MEPSTPNLSHTHTLSCESQLASFCFHFYLTYSCRLCRIIIWKPSSIHLNNFPLWVILWVCQDPHRTTHPPHQTNEVHKFFRPNRVTGRKKGKAKQTTTRVSTMAHVFSLPPSAVSKGREMDRVPFSQLDTSGSRNKQFQEHKWWRRFQRRWYFGSRFFRRI